MTKQDMNPDERSDTQNRKDQQENAGRAGNQAGGTGQGMSQNEIGQYGEIEQVAQAAGLDPYDGGNELEGVGNEMSVAGEGAEASYRNDPQDEAGNPEELGKKAVGQQPDESGNA